MLFQVRVHIHGTPKSHRTRTHVRELHVFGFKQLALFQETLGAQGSRDKIIIMCSGFGSNLDTS